MIVGMGVLFVASGLAVATNLWGVLDWNLRRQRWWWGDLLGPGSTQRAPSRWSVTWWRGSAVVLAIWGCVVIFLGVTGRWRW